jgi:hypothetical protein
MALAKKKLPQKPANLEELANLADAWADMCERHKFSGDSRPFVNAAGQQLREKAATIRALLLLKVAREI